MNLENNLNPELIYFVLKECNSNWRIENKNIMYYDMVFVLEGSADYIVNGYSQHVEKGDLIFIKPGSERSATTGGMRCAAFDFLLQDTAALELPVTLKNIAMEELTPYFREINSEWLQKNAGYRIKCHALFLLLLHRILYGNEKNSSNTHVNFIKRYIVEHFSEKIEVRDLAKILGLNPVYCGALFKKIQKCTISSYINQVRINKATDLLENEEYNISEVAYKTGFNDIYHFSASFKKAMGVSPSAYRNNREDYHD